ncbi:MAG TPA: FHA domain-containing protein [Vicinamibacteria bacterium]|nr:FHA domain-containing protein [Vicinamibacteria bacterium]
MSPAPARTVRFGECELDLDRRELRRDGVPCHLTPRAFALLELLVAERPKALSKSQLRQRLSSESYVSNTALAQLVTELRKAIGDEARKGRLIRTVFGYGYAFAGAAADEGDPTPDRPACWLRWGHHHLTLREGENVVGRGREAGVRLAVPEVSRQHARIVVQAGRATIEDLESRNGTTVRGRAVHRPTRLADGDEIGVGPERLVFCTTSDTASTRTTRRRG